MREMKDSGNQWIGIIPCDWSIDRFKYCTILYTGNSIKDEHKNDYEDAFFAKPYISSKDINRLFSTINYENGLYIKNNDYSFRVARKNDILMCIEGGSAGKKKALLNQDVCFVNKLCCFHSNYKVEHKFLFYYLCNPAYEDEFNYNITGMIGGVSVSRLSNLNIVYPKIDEQKRIAAYLDEQCRKIDEIIADIQNQIDTLEDYKKSVISEAVTRGLDPNTKITKSRIFYMAPYNKEWALTKIGYCCKKLWRAFAPEDTALICTNKGKVSVRPEEMTGKMVSEDNAMQGIKKGDIAIHGMDTWHGSVAYSDYDGKITRVVHVCDSTEDKRFVVYYLQQLAFNGVYKLISNGIRGNTSDFRSWDKVADIYIALPKVDEQHRISDYLDKKCAQIESIIEDKKAQLETIENYKKSLIYEYVTGKKEVVPSETN